MTITAQVRFTVVFFMLSASAAGADPNIRPGLWEMTTTSETKGDPMSMMSAAERAQMEKSKAEMEQAKAHMSPEQRAQMEAMMKKQIAIMAGPAEATVKKTCMTKEDIHNSIAHLAPEISKESGCKFTPVKSTATLIEGGWVCSSNGVTSKATMLFEAPNPETVVIKVEGSAARDGKVGVEMKMKSSGKWLGADCGGVKP